MTGSREPGLDGQPVDEPFGGGRARPGGPGSGGRNPAVPRPAATLILVRDGAEGVEVLGVRRAAGMRFLPGHVAFPGGAVDAADGRPLDGAVRGGVQMPQPGGDDLTAYAVAAVRECAEEIGWLCALSGAAGPSRRVPGPLRTALLEGRADLWSVLAALDETIDLSQLRYVGRWITPPPQPVRFDTRFFICRTGTAIQPDWHPAEHDWAGWRPARWLLSEMIGGRAQAVRPTRAMLEAVARCRTAEEAFTTLWVPGPVDGRAP
ncbi:NUDIX hydrolase [Alicyclobacillus sp.]|uniref:NUDIX hydrolase n=1 Tax=Alicyclobacillus sp. TaxID=61169 RepID=UPI0025B9CC19|nr:NUDIX hydrolase [Alicyclobacillus sp.]MCL6516639.1 NUDIX hydrolase [Alicyclobacillus sp.]